MVDSRIIAAARNRAAKTDARGRAALAIAIIRTIADTTDDGTGIWTQERSSLSLVIDAAADHRRRMDQLSQ